MGPIPKFSVSPTVCRCRNSGPKWYFITRVVGSSSSLTSLSTSYSGTSTSTILETQSLILKPPNLNAGQLSVSLQRNLSVGKVNVLTYSAVQSSTSGCYWGSVSFYYTSPSAYSYYYIFSSSRAWVASSAGSSVYGYYSMKKIELINCYQYYTKFINQFLKM